MMHRFLPALLVLALAVPASADILWFKNGRKLEGKVRELPDGRIEIAMSFGTMAFDADRIERVEEALTLEEIVQEALANLAPEDSGQLLELAAWCREHDADTLANRVLETLVSLDPDNAEARRRLGHTRAGDRWLSETEVREAREARGEVFFEGRWITAEEKERILLREELDRLRRRSERFEEASLELEIARLELESERSREDSRETVGIPLGSVWIPSGGHPPRRPVSRSNREKRPPKTQAPPAPRDNSSRVPAGRRSTGAFTPPHR
jgi:hypothetical protein